MEQDSSLELQLIKQEMPLATFYTGTCTHKNLALVILCSWPVCGISFHTIFTMVFALVIYITWKEEYSLFLSLFLLTCSIWLVNHWLYYSSPCIDKPITDKRAQKRYYLFFCHQYYQKLFLYNYYSGQSGWICKTVHNGITWRRSMPYNLNWAKTRTEHGTCLRKTKFIHWIQVQPPGFLGRETSCGHSEVILQQDVPSDSRHYAACNIT